MNCRLIGAPGQSKPCVLALTSVVRGDTQMLNFWMICPMSKNTQMSVWLYLNNAFFFNQHIGHFLKEILHLHLIVKWRKLAGQGTIWRKDFLPLWERGASPTLLSSCLCSSWCHSQMELSQSCQDAPWNVYVPSEPAWSPKNWGNSRHPMTWCSDTGPIESTKKFLVKVSCLMKTAELLSVSMRNTGSYIIQSMLFTKHNATFS